MTKVGAYFPSEYIKPDVELWDNAKKAYREVTVTITGVTARKFTSKDGKSEDTKPVVWFKGTTKGLIMNKTMMDSAAGFLGSDDDEDWRGKKITLCVVEVEAFGDLHNVIRVKAANGTAHAATAKVEPPPAALTMDDAADDIFGGTAPREPETFDPDEIPF